MARLRRRWRGAKWTGVGVCISLAAIWFFSLLWTVQYVKRGPSGFAVTLFHGALQLDQIYVGKYGDVGGLGLYANDAWYPYLAKPFVESHAGSLLVFLNLLPVLVTGTFWLGVSARPAPNPAALLPGLRVRSDRQHERRLFGVRRADCWIGGTDSVGLSKSMSKRQDRKDEQQEKRIRTWCKSPEQENQVRALVGDGWKLEFRVGEPEGDAIFLSRGSAEPKEVCHVTAKGHVQYSDDGAPPHCCQSCGYDLTGNTSGTCPECGMRR